jgi:hypothetical protein
MILINEAIRAAARELLDREDLNSDDRRKLRAIAAGERKRIAPDWWRAVTGHTKEDAKAKDLARLDAIKAMADPARNDNEHERKVAETMLAKHAPKKPRSAPGLEEYDREQAHLQEERTRFQEAHKRVCEEAHARMAQSWQATRAGGVNARKTPGGGGGVNAAPKAPGGGHPRRWC